MALEYLLAIVWAKGMVIATIFLALVARTAFTAPCPCLRRRGRAAPGEAI